MEINYKKISFSLFFLLCLSWGMSLVHDFHHVFLAISALLLAYGTVCFLFEGKLSRIIFFVLISVILCQVSVTAKRAMVDQGFRQQLKQDSAGVFIEDVIHGFCRIAEVGANDKADEKDDRTFIERANSRYMTMVILGSVMVGFLIFKKQT